MRNIVFSPESLASLQNYKSGNQKLLFKILELLDDVQKSPFAGLGKPEPLKGNLGGYRSNKKCLNFIKLVFHFSNILLLSFYTQLSPFR